MKHSTLNKKLKSYSALAGSLIAVSGTADAQVVYTDVSPDSLIGANSFYDLDLDNDGLKDFKLQQMNGTYYGYVYNVVYANPLAAMNAVDTAAGGGGFANAVNSGFSVDSTLNWVDSAGVAASYASLLALSLPALPSYNMGNFLGVTGKFLPLRIDVEGTVYYGWVRLTVPAGGESITVIDYAYKNAHMVPSITGVTTDVGISESAISGHVNIFAYDRKVTVQLDKNIPLEGNIVVRNMLGQTVSKTAVTNSEMIIPMDGAAAGSYLISIEQTSGAYTRKVVIR